MIGISAYVNQNLGDDLFIRMLVRRYPDEQFYIPSIKKCLKAFHKDKNITSLSTIQYVYIKLNQILYGNDWINKYVSNEYGKQEAVVHIGGSIFIETDNWEECQIEDNNQNIFYIGANFGPYYTEKYKNYVSNRLSSAKDCCFRDSYSQNQFNTHNNVRYEPDVLFGYSEYPEYKKGNCIGISVIDYKERNATEELKRRYFQGLLEICQYYQSIGKEIKILSFCINEGDEDAAQKLMEALDCKKGVRCVSYNGDIDSFLNEINECETIYATRFHAMIIGWMLHKKVLPIIYSNKQLNVIKDINYTGKIWNLLEGETLSKDILTLDIEQLDFELVETLKNRSKRQFDGLDRFLMKTGIN